ncbi:hypothetical protein VTN00DRAFT_776 [Thermoascus crustaceus]|uniref:uncharacterized protein n=1 Tax=Thermoascus crustaceus TaxID=5088 RepID=UPI003742506C
MLDRETGTVSHKIPTPSSFLRRIRMETKSNRSYHGNVSEQEEKSGCVVFLFSSIILRLFSCSALLPPLIFHQKLT